MNPSGSALTIWRQELGDDSLAEVTLWSSRAVAGSEWTLPEPISEMSHPGPPFTAYEGASYPDLAMDAQGNGMAVWGQFFDERWQLWANRFDASSGWEGAQLISTPELDAGRAHVGMDAEGNATVMWEQSGGNCGVWLLRYTLESGWGEPKLLGQGEGCGIADVVVGAAGDTLAVWLEFYAWYPAVDLPNAGSWAMRYTPGIGWGEREDMDSPLYAAPTYEGVAIDGDGNILLVGTGYNVIWANISPRPE